MKLISDFEDYYDKHFSNESDMSFSRLSSEELNRKQVFDQLKKLNLVTPAFGQVKKFLRKCKWEQAVVVYENINTHSGGEKRIMPYREALKYSNQFMSLYAASDPGVSYRYLKIGSLAYFLKYESSNWNSVLNTEKISIEEADPNFLLVEPPFSLYSIDFVQYKDPKQGDVMVAIDFNLFPKLMETGLEEILGGALIVKEIENYRNKSKK
jgi:hypothetical protein